MALKYFTNCFKGNVTDSIAINPKYVVSVFESEIADDEEGTNPRTVTNIFVGVTSFQVEESYLDVIARLNENE